MKKKNIVWPQYVKNAKGETTHVYLPIEAYDAISKELKEYEQLQKKEGIRWVQMNVTKKKPIKS